jgi:glutathione synthase
MKIGFLVNEIETEKTKFTTTRLAMRAVNMGHEIYYIGVGDLAYDPDDYIRARARTVKGKSYKSLKVFFSHLTEKKHYINKRITVEDLDVLMLRNDPSIEPSGRAWARGIGNTFGRLASKHGVIVLNDPNGLSKAMNKMYFQDFPEEIRPKTLITRDRDEIKKFAKELGKIVLKPLSGSGGKNVFLAGQSEIKNINQMIEAVSRDGYVVAQEFLPSSEDGDIRLFLMNGIPLRYKGKYAAFKRTAGDDDVRSNVHQGGQISKAEINENILRLAEIVRPKLVQDGMFLVGLDIMGDKLLEINVFTPGGLGRAQEIEGVNFCTSVIKALERKVKYMEFYKRKFNNAEMATL